MRAVHALRPGGPEVLEIIDTALPAPGPHQVTVEVAAAGVNYIDTYRRSGVYPARFPHVVGTEGAGTVTAVGAAVEDLQVGHRVAWADGSSGSYADQVLLDADRAVALPEEVTLEQAAAVMLQGLTAHYLATSTFPVGAGQRVLVHAGAGGVGLLLTQIAAARGATVLTTVSTERKADLSRAAGAHAVIRYDRFEDMATDLPRSLEQLGGPVDTVFDGVGAATFDASLASLRPRGGLALFGGSSGQVPPVDPQRLSHAGSVYLTRPTLAHHVVDRDELTARASDLFRWIAAGLLDVRVGLHLPLTGALEAHQRLEGRQTTGKVLLEP